MICYSSNNQSFKPKGREKFVDQKYILFVLLALTQPVCFLAMEKSDTDTTKLLATKLVCAWIQKNRPKPYLENNAEEFWPKDVEKLPTGDHEGVYQEVRKYLPLDDSTAISYIESGIVKIVDNDNEVLSNFCCTPKMCVPYSYKVSATPGGVVLVEENRIFRWCTIFIDLCGKYLESYSSLSEWDLKTGRMIQEKKIPHKELLSLYERYGQQGSIPQKTLSNYLKDKGL